MLYREVIELHGCHDGAKYDHFFHDNEDSAKECATALTRITGTRHEAMLVRAQWFLSNIFQVKKAQ